MAESNESPVVCSVTGGIGTLRLDRPQALHALDAETLRVLARAVRDLRREPSLRVVIVTGSGDRAFCAGADVAAMAKMTPADALVYSQLGHEVFSRIEALEVPVLAAVNGVALGGGLELALACDLIVAASEARLGLPEIKLGLIPGFGGTQRLALRVGLARARRLVYLGTMIEASEALHMGLVDRVVSRADLPGEVEQLAASLAGQAPLALRQAKRVTAAVTRGLLAAGLENERQAFAATFASDDREEGLRAFLEKRPPVWKGH
jgi:enoyl-CoA hydratase